MVGEEQTTSGVFEEATHPNAEGATPRPPHLTKGPSRSFLGFSFHTGREDTDAHEGRQRVPELPSVTLTWLNRRKLVP